MILSFSQRFAFVAVPRTGTQALRQRLRPRLAANDWEQAVRYPPSRFFPVADLTALGHGHITVSQIQPFLLPGMWQNLFSFGFVRDPVDRFLSCFYFLHRDGPLLSDPLPAMKQLLNGRDRDHVLLWPAHRFLCDTHGNIGVDFVGRYEHYNADISVICGRLGIDATPEPPVNASPRPVKTTIDRELREMITERYADDYRVFGYHAQ